REGLMQTIRWRLAAFYGVALTATIVAFGGALYVERRSSLLRDEEAQLRERIAFELDVNRRYIEDYSRSSRRGVTAVSAIGDLMSYELVPEVNAYLDGISDHLFLTDPAGRLLYVSRAARNLDPEALNLVRRTMLRQPIVRRVGTLQLDSAGAPYHFVIDTLQMPARAELRVILVAAQPSGDTSAASALLLSMLLVAPVILIGSSLLGYWLGGQALKPL